MTVSGIGINPEISVAPTLHPEVSPNFTFNFQGSKIDIFRNLFHHATCGIVNGAKKQSRNDNENIYLNHKGFIEPFKNVNMPEHSHLRSYCRVEYIVKETFKNIDGSQREQIYKRVQERANIDFDEEKRHRRALTVEKIKRIEKSLNEVAQELQVPLSPLKTPIPLPEDYNVKH